MSDSNSFSSNFSQNSKKWVPTTYLLYQCSDTYFDFWKFEFFIRYNFVYKPFFQYLFGLFYKWFICVGVSDNATFQFFRIFLCGRRMTQLDIWQPCQVTSFDFRVPCSLRLQIYIMGGALHLRRPAHSDSSGIRKK